MSIRYQAGRSARHVLGAITEGALLVAIVGALAFAGAVATGHGPLGAGKVEAGGKLTATISLGAMKASATTSGATQTSFNVTRSVADGTVYWVYNSCYNDAGKQVQMEGYPVSWGMWDSVVGVSGPFTLAGTHCKALVTIKPWSGQPLGNAILYYDVP